MPGWDAPQCSLFSFESHQENDCDYLPYGCPIPGCNQEFLLEDEGKHLETKHNVDQRVQLTLGAIWCEKFELEPSTSKVLVDHVPTSNQVATPLGMKPYITALHTKNSSTRYELRVWVHGEADYRYNFKSTTRMHDDVKSDFEFLLIPVHPGGPPVKIGCKIKLQRASVISWPSTQASLFLGR